MVRAHDGERTIFWERDESLCLLPEDLDPNLIASCRVLHLDGHFLEASLAAAKIAKESGVLVSLDGERVYPGTEKLVSLCDVVVGERSFPSRLTGEKDPDKALAILSEMGPAWVGRTMGSEGAVLLANGREYRRKAFKVKAVDTTGAGDILHAGMIHGILKGQEPEQALATACAVAAFSVTELGGRSALPDQAELRDFMEKQSS
jgi:sugar/nucleoside kinase (ribokinase family)